MPARKTMNVSMTPALERPLLARVAAGRYRTASEVFRAASRFLDKEEPLDEVCPPGERKDGHVGSTP